MCAAMLGEGNARSHPEWSFALIPVIGILAVHWALRGTTLEAAVERTPWPVRATVLAFIIFSLFVFPGSDRAFIYFQF